MLIRGRIQSERKPVTKHFTDPWHEKMLEKTKGIKPVKVTFKQFFGFDKKGNES